MRDIKILTMLISIFIMIIVISCDTRFWGSQLTGEQLTETVQIEGTVTDMFSGKPVNKARVRFGSQETLTGINGSFHISYLLNTDEKRNKPVPIEVQRDRYFTYSSSIILTNGNLSYDVILEYAAPIIEATVRWPNPSDNMTMICQAIVKDYQHTSNLKYVRAIFPLQSAGSKSTKSVTYTMSFVHMASDTVAYYQLVSPRNDSYTSYYYIEAMDRDGFSDRIIHYIRSHDQRTFLFDPFNP